MAKTAKERVEEFRQRQMKQGRRGRLLYLTKEEFEKVKAFIEALRK